MKRILAIVLFVSCAIAAAAQTAQQPTLVPVPTIKPQPHTVPQQRTPTTGQTSPVAVNTQVLVPSKPIDFRDVKLSIMTGIAIQQKMMLLDNEGKKSVESQMDDSKFQAAAVEIETQAWIKNVKHDNGWGDDVTFDRDRMVFTRSVPMSSATITTGDPKIVPLVVPATKSPAATGAPAAQK